MDKVYTFSRLGFHGALGNVLWQLAGVIGEAERNKVRCFFPDNFYRHYLSIPDYYFESKDGEVIDWWPDYMQDLNHFKHCEVLIREYFSPSDHMMELLTEHFPWDTNEGTTISVHVRRGNNLGLPNHHPVPTLDYFEEALDHFNYDNLLVCSDDLDWCRKQNIFKDALFGVGTPPGVDISRLTDGEPLPNEQAIIDMFMMKFCDGHVISNSSLSWWSAWLGDGPVVYPRRWYGEAYRNIDTSVMFPLDWVAV